MSVRAVATIVLIVATAVLAGCARKPPEPAKTAPPSVVVDYPFHATGNRQVRDYEDFAGRTEPVMMVELRSRVTGHLTKIHFKDGQDIKKGEPLFDIDSRTYKADLGTAYAMLARAEARRGKAVADEERARVGTSSGVNAKVDLDQAVADHGVADADIKTAKEAIDKATANLQYCKIDAPFDGRMSKRMLDEGNLVKADDTALTTIVKLDQVYATFDMDERTVIRVRRLVQKGEVTSSRERPLIVQIALADDDDFSLSGLVTFVDNQIDAGTGTLRVRATVQNPKLNRAPWYLLSPGQFVRVRVPIGLPRDAILVPEKALGSDQGQRFVFVVNAQNVVERRNVRVGQQYDQSRVIEDGVVSPSDRIIVDGLLRVRPGLEVTPKPAPPTPAKSPPSSGIAALNEAPAPHAKVAK